MATVATDSDLGGLVAKAHIWTDECKIARERFNTKWVKAALAGMRIFALILGEAGTGKSQLMAMLAVDFKVKRNEQGLQRKVVTAEVPSSPTPIAILETLLEALGDPSPHSGTKNKKMARLVKALHKQGVLLIFLDDLQHMVDRDSECVLYSCAECLKEIFNRSKVSIISAGLPDAKDVVNANEQLSRRYVGSVGLSRFDWKDHASKAQFKAVLKAFRKRLSMFDMPDIGSEPMGFRFYLATGGIMDFVAKILTFAVLEALNRKTRKITLSMLESAWKEALWHAKKWAFSPFSSTFDATKDIEDRLLLARKINQRTRRPVSKRKASKSATAVAGL